MTLSGILFTTNTMFGQRLSGFRASHKEFPRPWQITRRVFKEREMKRKYNKDYGGKKVEDKNNLPFSFEENGEKFFFFPRAGKDISTVVIGRFVSV